MCAGEGGPGLVLLAGFGGDSLDWTPVIPALAVSQRVCAVDRLGQGWSEPARASPQQTMITAVDQVHEAVLAVGMQQPIVVGHSLGGAYAQIYAARHPVAGVLLVEGLTAGAADSVLERLGKYQMLAPAAELGLLRPIAGMLVDPAYTGALRTEMVALRSRSAALLSMTQEGAVAQRSGGAEIKVAEATLKIRPVPLLVLAAGASDVPDLPPGAFVDAEREFADSVPGAQFKLIARAHHYLMAEQPQIVTELTRVWLDSIVER
jgi:pimeloyl-ACP methyl ester carboxylesterase